MHGPVWIACILDYTGRVAHAELVKVALAGSVDFVAHRKDVGAEATAALLKVGQVESNGVNLGKHVGVFYGFSANNNFSTLVFAFMGKFCVEGLSFGAHDFGESNFYHSDGIEWVVAVIVDHLKFELLMLFKEVSNLDCCLEIRVQVVVNAFCLSNMHPFFWKVIKLVNFANGVRLGKNIQVFKLATGDE
jgi:hypothetical protein